MVLTSFHAQSFTIANSEWRLLAELTRQTVDPASMLLSYRYDFQKLSLCHKLRSFRDFVRSRVSSCQKWNVRRICERVKFSIQTTSHSRLDAMKKGEIGGKPICFAVNKTSKSYIVRSRFGCWHRSRPLIGKRTYRTKIYFAATQYLSVYCKILLR